jgi:hypothetical protein
VNSDDNGTDQRGGEMQQHHTIHDVIARDHVDILRREARQARLAARARRASLRPFRRSR